MAVAAVAGGSEDPRRSRPTSLLFCEVLPFLFLALAKLRRKPWGGLSESDWADLLDQIAYRYVARAADPACRFRVACSADLETATGNYVRRAAARRVRGHQRAKGRRDNHLHQLAPLAFGAERGAYRCPGAPAPHKPLVSAQLREALDSLPEFDKRHASSTVIPSRDLVQGVLEGRTLVEIATRVGVPYSHLRQQWHLVRVHLQRFLDGPCAL